MLRWVAPLALPALLGGCAMLPGLSPSPQAAAVADGTGTGTGIGTTSPGPLAVNVRIEAPTPLRTLLERYLDLTRLGSLSRGDDLGEAEWRRLIDASPAQVRDLLQTEGYFRPTVTVRLAPDRPPGQPREVTLVVDPGPRAKVSRLTLIFGGELQDDALDGNARATALIAGLQGLWPLQAGSEFRNATWADAKAATLARLRAAGYAAAGWSGTAAEVDAEANTVRLFLVADSGPLFRAGDIEVEGLVVHEAATVRNLAEFKRGDPLSESALLDYQDRLQKAGLFESVTVTHDLDPERAGSARVLVTLREQTLQVYTFGVGYSANTRARASVEHVHRRLLGYPLRSRSYLELGTQLQVLDVELSTHPDEGLRRRVAGAAIRREDSGTDVISSQRLRFGLARDGQREERLDFIELERSARDVSQTRSGVPLSTEAIALSVNRHLVFRDLDSTILPTSGHTLALQGGLGRSYGSGTPSGFFTRAYGRYTGYWPLGSRWYSQGRIELGQVFRQNGVLAPDSQLWRAGGDDSVRGYGYRDLGPVVDGVVTSGAALFTSSLELARPVSETLPSLWGAVFIDAGRAANSFRQLEPALGYGVGVRWRSPVGPLKLDWAWGRDVGRGRLHFSVGIAL